MWWYEARAGVRSHVILTIIQSSAYHEGNNREDARTGITGPIGINKSKLKLHNNLNRIGTMFMAMLIPGNECNGLFHVWTEPDRRCIDCLLFVLSLFRKLGCDQRLSRDTIVSICCQREWWRRGEWIMEPARRFCPPSLLSSLPTQIGNRRLQPGWA